MVVGSGDDQKNPRHDQRRGFSFCGHSADAAGMTGDSPGRREAASCHWRIRSKAVGGFHDRRLCLVPIRAVVGRVPGHDTATLGVGPTTGISVVRLRTSIRSRWHLSHLFSRLSVSRGFDRWAGSGEKAVQWATLNVKNCAVRHITAVRLEVKTNNSKCEPG